MEDLFNVILVVGVIAVVYFSVFRNSNKKSNSKSRDPIRDLYGDAFGRFRKTYIDTRPDSDLLKKILNDTHRDAIFCCFNSIEYDYRIPKDDYDAEAKILFIIAAQNRLIKAVEMHRKGVIATDEERYENEQLIYFCNNLIQDYLKNENVNAKQITHNAFIYPLVQLGIEAGCNLDNERLMI